jgi:arginine/lysine/ornithine decarboxylase
MSGLADNFQLHTLLADALVGGGHIEGRAPSAEEVAVCRDAPGQVPTTGSFNLVTPGGEWVWNEGTPADIPVVDGVRLLVLDPPPYERGWPAGRFFPGMTGALVLERVLDARETRGWLEHCAPAK